MAEAALSVKNISKTFAGQQALVDVSFDVERGTVHALLGHNGSGKSTLIRILAGNHRPDPGAGEIAVGSETLAQGSPAEAHQLGLRFVHQDLALVLGMSALENVELGASTAATRFGLIDSRTARRNTEALLARLGSSFDVTRPLAQCRHVDRSAVAIGRAMMDLDRDGLLVLDEPTAALPPHESTVLFELVQRFVRDGGTVIYVTHRLDEVFTLAQHVTVLRDGEVVGSCPVAGLERRELVRMIVGDRIAGEPLALPDANELPLPTVGVAGDGNVLDVVDLESALLHGVSLHVRPGEIVGVAGLAGSGRDQVCAALVGAVPSDYESLVVDGIAITGGVDPATAMQAGLVMVPGNRQPGSRIATMNVRENLTLPVLGRLARRQMVRSGRERERARWWISALSVRPSDPEASFATLSGGNQQKVIVAKWLETRPRVVALDEPTAGVDVVARESIYTLIREAVESGVGFVVCSSDVEDLATLCSRVLVIVEGQVAEEMSGAGVSESALLGALFQPAGNGG